MDQNGTVNTEFILGETGKAGQSISFNLQKANIPKNSNETRKLKLKL
jgi:hypothetical protein